MSARAAAVCVALAAALGASVADAAVRIELRTDPPDPVAGQPFRVVYGLYVHDSPPVTATPLDMGRLEVLANPGAPQLPNFVVFGGGSMTMNSTVEYIARAPAAGRYVVRGARAVDPQSGRVVTEHPPLTITVRAADPNAPPQPQPQPPPPPGFPPGIIPGIDELFPQPPPAPVQDPDAPPAGDLRGAVFNPSGFLRLAVDNPTPYVGQQATLRAWIYVPAYDAGCEPERLPTLTGFWSQSLLPARDVCAQRWIPQAVNGQQMSAGLVLKQAVIPTHAGRLEIGSMAMTVQYLTGESFFPSRRQVHLESPSLVVEAREPPAEGRPPNYVPGTLGPITLVASLDRDRATVGETVVLTVRADGPGYLSAVGIPAPPDVEGVRRHEGASRADLDPSTDQLRAVVREEYLLVPTRPGRVALGRLDVPYFDPGANRYDVARVELPTLTVMGEALPQEAPEARSEDPAVTLEPFDPNPSLRPHRAWFTGAWRTWGTIALPPALALLAALGVALRRRVRALRAVRAEVARTDPDALLAQAEAAAKRGDAKAAADLAGRALDRAKREHGTAHLDGAGRGALAEAQGACDAARFAGERADAGDLVARVTTAVRALEKGA